jgi:hypothetical protein
MYWLQGETGGGSRYNFSPKPAIAPNFPGQRLAQFELPNVDGAILQKLGTKVRRIALKGVIYVRPANYDNLLIAKQALEDGIGNSEGQLHLESTSGAGGAQHIYYKAILDGDINWAEQTNMQFLDYHITLLCVDPVEYNV